VSFYRRLIKLVDDDLTRGPRVKTVNGKTTVVGVSQRPFFIYFSPITPLLIVIMIEGFPARGPSGYALLVGGAIGVALAFFIGWRQWRLFRASAIKSGRYYERTGRYFLPSEYHDSEDSLLAERRRKSHD
jgi:hypothetical protein